MDQPCIITAAITGSVPRKSDNPAVPISVGEQVESAHAAFEAGASLIHLHVRDEDGAPSVDAWRFAKAQDGIRRHCPGVIVQFSSSATMFEFQDRTSKLRDLMGLKPDMISFTTGSTNFRRFIYDNPPAYIDELATEITRHGVKPEIEVFDLAMLHNAIDLVERGLLRGPLHVQLVLGVRNAQPARREILEFELSELRQLMPEATWTGAGVGRFQLEVNAWTLALGGHCRTGLEDNVRFDKGRLAASNAELVRRVAAMCAERDRPVARPHEARAILGLPSPT